MYHDPNEWKMQDVNVVSCTHALPRFLHEIGMPRPMNNDSVTISINGTAAFFQFQKNMSDPLGYWHAIEKGK